MENIKKSAEFRNDWEQSNIEKWAVNMAVRKMQREKDAIFISTQETKKVQAKTMSEMNAMKSMDKDIDEFEKRVLGKDDDSDSGNERSEKPPQRELEKKNTLIGLDKNTSKISSMTQN